MMNQGDEGWSSLLTIWIGSGLDGMQQLHCRDVIDVYLVLEHDDQSLPVHLDSQNGGRKNELADSGLSLALDDTVMDREHGYGHRATDVGHAFVLTIWSFRGELFP